MYVVLHTTALKKTKVHIQAIEEASDVWKTHRNGDNSHGTLLGASDMKGDCGNVYSDDDSLIATVMYNGRLKEKENTADSTTVVDGQMVGIGDYVSYKADVEVSGEIIKIKNDQITIRTCDSDENNHIYSDHAVHFWMDYID